MVWGCMCAVCACVYHGHSTEWIDNTWICQYFKFIPSTHTHTHYTIWGLQTDRPKSGHCLLSLLLYSDQRETMQCMDICVITWPGWVCEAEAWQCPHHRETPPVHSQTRSAPQGLDSLLDRSGPAVLSAVSQGNTAVHQIGSRWYWNKTGD